MTLTNIMYETDQPHRNTTLLYYYSYMKYKMGKTNVNY